MRERNKSIDLFKSTHQSNKDLNDYYDAMHEDDLMMQEDMLNTIVFATSNNADNLYYRQAMKARNARDFQKEIIKEVNAHIELNQWELISG